tara:strand:+ start:3430 stop:4956 length:1527 start_codon:yes stop_codon:yes gene_type:complete
MASVSSLATGGTGKGGTSNTNQILYRAVVTEVFSNPQGLTPIQKNIYKNTPGKQPSNERDFDKMPRNSISAILISESGGTLDTTPQIFYPLFSPHLAMPIKPGEQVIVIFTNTNAGGRGFWVTRVSTDINVDDPNYTHGDRVQPETPGSGLVGIASGAPPGGVGLTFPNGGGQASNFRLPGILGYENIMLKSFAMRLPATTGGVDAAWLGNTGQSAALGAAEFTGEPVPRFSKNAQDLALQGSNNTLISMGTDWTYPMTPAGALAYSMLTGRGSIDIVAGRGQGGISSALTGPPAVSNTRLYQENDKNSLVILPTEGKQMPDDISRVYVTMSGVCDFIMAPGQGSLDLVDGATDPLNLGLTPEPYAVMKSKHVRLISPIGGTIRLICGGGVFPPGAATSGLLLSADSTQLVGVACHVGLPNPGTAFKMVYGDTLHAALTALISSLNAVGGTLTAAGGSMAAPVAGAVAAGPQIASAGSSLTAAASAFTAAIGAAPVGSPILSQTTTVL